MRAPQFLMPMVTVGLLAAACGEPVDGLVDGRVDAGGEAPPAAGRGETHVDPPGPLPPSFPAGTVPCGDRLWACGNGQDDDGDGLVDARDPDCLGPCDHNEAGFDPGAVGPVFQDCWADCYFDRDGGRGNDDCSYHLGCDPRAPAPHCPWDDTCTQPGQSSLCLDFCGNLTPNGCDCFGCCDLSRDGSGDFRFLGTGVERGEPTCTLAAYARDPDACAPCTPATGCFTECGRCQLCLNKDEVPEDCPADGEPSAGGEAQCPGGEQPCGLLDPAPCDAGHYCVTGCCRPAP